MLSDAVPRSRRLPGLGGANRGPMDLRCKIRLGLSCLRYWTTREARPVAMAWLITGRCNLRCTYCMWKHLRPGKDLPTGAVKGLIDEMAAAGVLLVSLTGGEPLMRPDIGEIVRHIKRRGLICKVNTNGILVRQRLDDLREVDLLQVSIDGPPGVHDVLRGEGTGAEAARGLDLARREGIPCQVVTCLTSATVERFDEVVDWAVRRKLRVHVQLLSGNFVAPDDLARSQPERRRLVEVLDRLLQLKRGLGPRSRAIASSTGSLRKLRQRVLAPGTRCEGAPVSATLLPDGKLIFCANARTHQAEDATALGFAEAFARLTVPACQGCECIGRLRVSSIYDLDPSVIWEVLRL